MAVNSSCYVIILSNGDGSAVGPSDATRTSHGLYDDLGSARLLPSIVALGRCFALILVRARASPVQDGPIAVLGLVLSLRLAGDFLYLTRNRKNARFHGWANTSRISANTAQSRGTSLSTIDLHRPEPHQSRAGEKLERADLTRASILVSSGCSNGVDKSRSRKISASITAVPAPQTGAVFSHPGSRKKLNPSEDERFPYPGEAPLALLRTRPGREWVVGWNLEATEYACQRREGLRAAEVGMGSAGEEDGADEVGIWVEGKDLRAPNIIVARGGGATCSLLMTSGGDLARSTTSEAKVRRNAPLKRALRPVGKSGEDGGADVFEATSFDVEDYGVRIDDPDGGEYFLRRDKLSCPSKMSRSSELVWMHHGERFNTLRAAERRGTGKEGRGEMRLLQTRWESGSKAKIRGVKSAPSRSDITVLRGSGCLRGVGDL
ncbi:hypothetical protein DFH09DRAFT_1073199 [Mycena vulgaris]|nr:hypothetical protein DFH09DRAFT_1073199 [Mycena vulgaris]